MEVHVFDLEQFGALASEIQHSVRQRIGSARALGMNVSELDVSFSQPRPIPKALLQKVLDLFREANNFEIPADRARQEEEERLAKEAKERARKEEEERVAKEAEERARKEEEERVAK